MLAPRTVSLAVLIVAVAAPSLAQPSAADSAATEWLTFRGGILDGGAIRVYQLGGGGLLTDPTSPWLAWFEGGLRVLDASALDLPADPDSSLLSNYFPFFEVGVSVGRRLGDTPLVVKAEARGWVPPVPVKYAAGGDVSVGLALVPRGLGPTVGVSVYLSGARGFGTERGRRGVGRVPV